jgi:hypothetical protein
MIINPSPFAVVIRVNEGGFATDTPRESFRGVVDKVGEGVPEIGIGDVVLFEAVGTKIDFNDNIYWVVPYTSVNLDVSKG